MAEGQVPLGVATTLAEDIDTAVTAFDVADASVFPQAYFGYTARIIQGSLTEDVVITNIATNTLTVTRAASPSAFTADIAEIRWLATPGSGGSTSPGGSDPQVQYNSGGSFAGAANVTIDADDLVVGEVTSTPASPAAGSKIFSMLRAGRTSFMTLGATGPAQGYAPDWLTIPRVWTAGTGNVLDTIGTPAPTPVAGGGSAVAQAVADTNFLTQFLRLRLTTSAVANNHAGVRAGTATIFTSASSNRGGFFWQAAFAIHTAPSSARYFIGVYGTSSSVPMTGGAEPSTFLNCAGFMVDSGESVFSWGVNDGTGTCTRTSITGAALTGDTYRYVASICALPGSTDIYYALEQYDTSGALTVLADSVSTTDTPVAGTLLYDYVHGTPSAANTLSLDISCVTLQKWR